MADEISDKQDGVNRECRTCGHKWVGEPGTPCPACGIERPDIYGWKR